MSSFSPNFAMLAVLRFVAGTGLGAWGCLSPPMILDFAPHDKRTTWIGIFYTAVPLGIAFGFIYGALVSAAFGDWYYPFIIEVFFLVPLMLVFLLSYKDPRLYAKKNEEDKEKITTQLLMLGGNPIYMCTVLGCASSSFTFGGLVYWVFVIQAPDFVESYYNVSSSTAALGIGAITIISGIIGTGTGSLILNKLMKKYELMMSEGSITNEKLERYRVEKSCEMILVGMSLGMVATVGSILFSIFFAEPWNFLFFIIGIGIGEFLIFATTSPNAFVIMNSVPKHVRPQANAVYANVSHILGDLPSPTIIGAWIEVFGYYLSMTLASAWLIFAVLLSIVAWNFSVGYI